MDDSSSKYMIPNFLILFICLFVWGWEFLYRVLIKEKIDDQRV